eukprot:365065-Chlamydomonas_euryale.AAC.7
MGRACCQAEQTRSSTRSRPVGQGVAALLYCPCWRRLFGASRLCVHARAAHGGVRVSPGQSCACRVTPADIISSLFSTSKQYKCLFHACEREQCTVQQKRRGSVRHLKPANSNRLSYCLLSMR